MKFFIRLINQKLIFAIRKCTRSTREYAVEVGTAVRVVLIHISGNRLFGRLGNYSTGWDTCTFVSWVDGVRLGWNTSGQSRRFVSWAARRWFYGWCKRASRGWRAGRI